MARKSQFSRMVKVMDKYNIYDNKNDELKIYDPDALDAAITDEDREALYSAYQYIMWTSKLPKPKWMTKTESDGNKKITSYFTFEELFGIGTEREDEKILSFDKVFDFDGFLNIEAYKEFARISKSQYSSEWKDGKENEYATEIPEIAYYSKSGKKYNLQKFFFSLDSNINTSTPIWYAPDDDITFCFTSIEYKYNTERKLFKSYYYSGFVFYK